MQRGSGGSTYQNCSSVRSDTLGLAIASHHGFPYLIEGRSLIVHDHCEERAVPPGHAVGLLVAEDKVLEVFLRVWLGLVVAGPPSGIHLAAPAHGRSNVHLWTISSFPTKVCDSVPTTQLGVCTALASQFIWYRNPLM